MVDRISNWISLPKTQFCFLEGILFGLSLYATIVALQDASVL